MTTLIAEIYDALREAGASEEAARKAAEAVAQTDTRFGMLDTRLARMEERQETLATKADLAALRGELVLVKWMPGVLLAGVVSLVLKAFFA